MDSTSNKSPIIEQKIKDLLCDVFSEDCIAKVFMPATFDNTLVYETLVAGLKKGEIPNAASLAKDLTEWPFSVAFLFCLHLWPERFTNKEISDGFHYFVADAGPHISDFLDDSDPPLI